MVKAIVPSLTVPYHLISLAHKSIGYTIFHPPKLVHKGVHLVMLRLEERSQQECTALIQCYNCPGVVIDDRDGGRLMSVVDDLEGGRLMSVIDDLEGGRLMSGTGDCLRELSAL